MKKVIAVFIIAFVVSVSGFAQSAVNPQSLVGTWIDNEGDSWTFRANGELSIPEYEDTKFSYVIIGAKIAIAEDDGSLTVYNIFVSSDGKTAILDLSSKTDSPYLDRPFMLKKR